MSKTTADAISSFPQVSGRELDQLARFAATLGATLDVDTLVEDAAEPLCAMATASHVVIAVSGDNTRVLQARYVRWPDVEVNAAFPALPVAALGVEAMAFAQVVDMPAPLAQRLSGVRGTVAVVPLWANAQLRGAVFLHRSSGVFSGHMLKMLTTAGRQLALAVENAHLLEDLQDSYRRLMDTQEDLIRAERLAALGQLSATMAHEIRNPLATIFSALAQLRKYVRSDELIGTLLNIAEEEATRLNTMVEELLQFARPRKPIFEQADVRAVVETAVKTFAGVDKGGVQLSVTEDSESAVIPIDEELVRRAVDLLLDNAAAACEERGADGRIACRVRRVRDGACIEVRDNGVGIRDADLPRVFEPFFSSRPTGTGLGLPTVKRIAEDHRGGVEIESAEGVGTTVTVYLQTRDSASKRR